MSRQEKRVAREKAAAAEAAQIVEQAVAKVTAEAAPAQPVARRTRALSPEHAALAPEVKALRDEGMAWWLIGHTLSLPGSGETVREGKAGAAFARRIYASGFGEVPRTQQRNGTRANREKNDEVRRIKGTTKRDRVEQVRSGASVIREDMPNDEVIDMLRGRVIGWHIDTSRYGDNPPDVPQYLEQEAGVHRQWAKVEFHDGERCLVFKTFEPKGPLSLRGIAGATRIVRIKTIHTVR